MTESETQPSVDVTTAPEPAEGPASETIDPTDHARVAAEYKDKLLRALAEMENLRRRTEREIADSRAYGISSFARDLLGVADNLARSVNAVSAELREKADAGVKALLEGVELTEREMIKVLERHGVRRFEAQGQRFDPNRHQAMFEIPDPSQPAGTVAQVVQPGYMIGERVLRPAMVGVAKGGPKPAADAPASEEPEQEGGSPAITDAPSSSSERD
jgi:molecular chaperone GrpE